MNIYPPTKECMHEDKYKSSVDLIDQRYELCAVCYIEVVSLLEKVVSHEEPKGLAL